MHTQESANMQLTIFSWLVQFGRVLRYISNILRFKIKFEVFTVESNIKFNYSKGAPKKKCFAADFVHETSVRFFQVAPNIS